MLEMGHGFSSMLYLRQMKLSSVSFLGEHTEGFTLCFVLLRIQSMTTLLNVKEDSLRTLKETLRKSQQGEESCKSAVCVCVDESVTYN